MPPFALPSSFVSATPVTPTASPNRRACCSPFWPGRRVDDEQRLVRGAFELALDHASHLRQLLHQVRLRVQPAGGVDDHDVARRRGSRARSRRRRPTPGRLRARRRRTSRPRARPRSRAAPRRRRETCRPRASTTEWPCCRSRSASLPIVVVLPVPLTPTTSRTLGSAVHVERAGIAEQRGELLRERRARGRSGPAALRGAARARPSRARRRRRGSAPPRAAPTPRRHPGSNAADASSAVSARRLFESESRRREKSPARSASRLGLRVLLAEEL